MKSQRLTVVAHLVGASLFGASRPYHNTNANNQDLAFQPVSKANTHYLPSSFYDALENPISKDEYWRQIDYEQQSGIPFARDKAAERANSNKTVYLLVHTEIQCTSDADAATHITEQGICHEKVKGESVFVNSLPSNCQVVTFTDDKRKEDPLDVVPVLNAASRCYGLDAFESVRVVCRPLPL